jgi:hypothetical protein
LVDLTAMMVVAVNEAGGNVFVYHNMYSFPMMVAVLFDREESAVYDHHTGVVVVMMMEDTVVYTVAEVEEAEAIGVDPVDTEGDHTGICLDRNYP